MRGSVADYLARFGFKSELLTSMYAVTDGLSGLNAGPDDPGTGHNFLVHNMCRLPGLGRHLDDRGGRDGHGVADVRRRRPGRRGSDQAPARGSRPSPSTLGAASGVVLADGQADQRPGRAGRLRPVPR